MTDFWKSETYRIVQAMKATGNQPGVVEQWRRQAELWAATNDGPDAAALRAWLPLWSVRPWYTAAELAPMFPALGVLLGVTERPSPVKSANRLANELKFAGLPVLGSYYADSPIYQEYFIVEHIHKWRDIAVTQSAFEKFMGEFQHAQR